MNARRRWMVHALCAIAGVMGVGCEETPEGVSHVEALRDEHEAVAQNPDFRAAEVGGRSLMDAGLATQAAAASPDASTGTAAATPTGGITCADRIAPTAEAVEQVLQRSCGLSRSCHAGASPQAGLDLSSLDGIFATAVNRLGMQNAELPLIAEGKPELSYLMRKIDNAQAVGTAMPPPPSGALCEAKRSAIEGWIRAGAPR